MRINKMLMRISAWFHSLVRKLKQKWWLWMSIILAGLLEERIFKTINDYADRHIGWIGPTWSFLMRSRSGIGITIFGGTILVLVILAYIDTRPVTKPRLTVLSDWRSGGLYDLQDGLIGWELPISNTETRFHTTANNVQAKITFRHTSGNTFISNPAVWLFYAPKRGFADRVSIGMGETARLLVCVARNDSLERFAATPPWPFELDAKHLLEFGQWNVQIELSGDNVKSTYEGTLTLNAIGSVILEMES